MSWAVLPTWIFVTIADNSGDGIQADVAFDLSNSIVADNTGNDVDGAINSGGFNVIGDATGGSGFVGSDLVDVDPMLEALADNGGPTLTHSFATTSVAYNAGSAAGAPAEDQRGALRDNAPDIGAFELKPSLWFSTRGDVAAPSGVSGLSDWGRDDALTLNDPNLNLGAGTSDGTVQRRFEIDTFADDGNARLDALHYVTTDITVGGANAVNLQVGDILFSTDATETFHGGSVTIDRQDVGLFRPTAPGDFSGGTFSVLLDELSPSSIIGRNVYSISLVEQDTTVGDATLSAGDFLFTHLNPFAANDVFVFETADVGSGTTSGTTTKLIEGDDLGLNVVSSFLMGLELIETPMTIGGTALASGTLLLQSTGTQTGWHEQFVDHEARRVHSRCV